MFERFTESARSAVTSAGQYARAQNADRIAEEHLFAALRDTPAGGSLLRRLGVDGEVAQAVLGEVRDTRRRGGLGERDAEALATLGIDLDAVVAQAQANLGPDALGGSGPGGPRRSGRLRFAESAKLVLSAALRHAVTRNDRELREEHLLLGLLTVRGPLDAGLAAHGVTVASAIAALDDDTGASKAS